MSEFKQYAHQYIRVEELRPVTFDEICSGLPLVGLPTHRICVSDAARATGSPKIGDMIARDPKNHADQWLVEAEYFARNFTPVPEA